MLCGGAARGLFNLYFAWWVDLLSGEARRNYARTVTGIFRPGITQPTTKSCKQHEHAKLNFVAVRYFGIINLPRKNQWDN